MDYLCLRPHLFFYEGHWYARVWGGLKISVTKYLWGDVPNEQASIIWVEYTHRLVTAKRRLGR